MSRKQEIYSDMLWWALPYIRNVQTRSWLVRARDRSCYFEAELVHNLPNSLLEPEFGDHDIWFLNHQAKWFTEKCSPQDFSGLQQARGADRRAVSTGP